jgi:hypothetical protein
MDYVGIDASKKQSQIYLFSEAGEVLHQRLYTQREQLRAALIGANASRPTGGPGSKSGAGTASGSLSHLSSGPPCPLQPVVMPRRSPSAAHHSATTSR